MKTLNIILTITLLCITDLAGTQSFANFHQFWYNVYLEKTIEIEYFGNGIKVSGLHYGNNHTWFKRRSSSTYYNRFGGKLKILRNKIVYYDNRTHSRLTFLPINSRTRSYSNTDDCKPSEHDYYDYDSSFGHEQHRQSKSSYDNDREQRNRSKNDISSSKQNNLDGNTNSNSYPMPISSTVTHDQIEGTWQVEDLPKKVYIVDTRDGIKARFSDNLTWYIYKKRTENHLFISENGQKYTLKNNKLIWSNADNTKSFSMIKISDDLND
jgi:hypothetical protein